MSAWATGQRWVRVRLVTVGIVLVVLLASLVARAWRLQIKESKKYRELAEDQYLKEVELPSRRGRILDRHGVELAASAEVESLWVNPAEINALGHGEEIVRAFHEVLHIDLPTLRKALRTHRHFVWVKRRLSPEEAAAVRGVQRRGVYFTKEPRRWYPNRALAGPVLGWAGLDGVGLEGLELHYDKQLRGARAEIQGLRDALGREVFSEGLETPGHGGYDLVTTIDKFIQYRLERALEAGVERNHAKAGVAVVLDPKSGEILAMAAVPTVNPNDPSLQPGQAVRNRAVTDPFEPGSTMKTFSISAAIEAGLVKPEEHWYCENGKYQIGPATIHDAEKIGDVTTTQVLAESSNICTAKIARRSGRERVHNLLRRFGFGAATGIDLPGERGGVLRPVERWGEVELATVAFGQGITATPLQVARGYATIANGGTLFRPRVVSRVVDDKGHVVTEFPPEGHRVLAPEVAATMRQMLFAVIQPGGTGEKLAIPGYRAGGKTGTAQKVDPATRRYSTDKWASSFVGFAPLDDPRLVIFVMVDEPSGTHYGSMVAGPVWRETMEAALHYLHVKPSEPAAVATMPPSTSGSAPAIEEEGVVSVSEEEVVTPGAVEVPDFTGLSLGEAVEMAQRAHLALEIAGSGRVVNQSPGPGRARASSRCHLQLSPPG